MICLQWTDLVALDSTRQFTRIGTLITVTNC